MSSFQLITAALVFAIVFSGSNAQLSPTFYDKTCPNAYLVAFGVMKQAAKSDVRIGAKIIRMFFHDCIAGGCDGSILLDNATGIESEKGSISNTSIEGFEIVDAIKAALERFCPGVVSCADILALASQIGVVLAGMNEPWKVQLGRRDSRTANKSKADNEIPSPFDDFTVLNQKFTTKRLDATDLVALSGAHTFGRAQCFTFDRRLNTTNPDTTLDPKYSNVLRQKCIVNGNGSTLVNLDVTTPDFFDNKYFTNLQTNRGLLTTDQMLFSTPGAATVAVVNRFAGSQSNFFKGFGKSMNTLGNIGILTGNRGEIRSNCRRVNSLSSI